MYHLLSYNIIKKRSHYKNKHFIPILQCYKFSLLEKNIKKYIFMKQFLLIDLKYISLL